MDMVPRFNLVFSAGRTNRYCLKQIYEDLSVKTIGNVRMARSMLTEYHRRVANLESFDAKLQLEIDKLLRFNEISKQWTQGLMSTIGVNCMTDLLREAKRPRWQTPQAHFLMSYLSFYN